MTAVALCCGDPDREPRPGDVGDRGTAPEPPEPPATVRLLCGRAGEVCCDSPLPACEVGAACDASAGRCVATTDEAELTLLCRSDLDCPSASTCCLSGALGTCAPSGTCALPDLTLVDSIVPGFRLQGLLLNTRADDCAAGAGCECLLEKGCVLGEGARRVLRLEPLPVNIGGADLLLGDPDSSPAYSRDRCSGEPLVERYLRYELIDGSGAVTHRHDARLVPHCDTSLASSDPLPERLSCDNQGLERGLLNATFDAFDDGEYNGRFGAADCPYVDITGLPGGLYELRITINPERTFAEASYDNNTLRTPVELPAVGDPERACSPLELDHFADPLECGWRPALPTTECVPGTPVQLECPDCTGLVLARVCAGDAPCSATEALHNSADPNECPRLDFECPASGRYQVLVSAAVDWYIPLQLPPAAYPFECNLVAASSAGAGAPP
jgi:hypothetical protein